MFSASFGNGAPESSFSAMSLASAIRALTPNSGGKEWESNPPETSDASHRI
jgi:hypothetical protein